MMWKFLAFKCNKLFLFDFWILERFLISYVLTLKQRGLYIKVLLSAKLIFLEHLIVKIISAKFLSQWLSSLKIVTKWRLGIILYFFIYIMALNMLRKIARNIQQAKFYSVMGDEAADISNKEQLILCIRLWSLRRLYKKS